MIKYILILLNIISVVNYSESHPFPKIIHKQNIQYCKSDVKCEWSWYFLGDPKRKTINQATILCDTNPKKAYDFIHSLIHANGGRVISLSCEWAN